MTRATSERDEDQHDRADDQREPELAERVLDRPHVMDEVEGRAAPPDPAADDQARRAGDRRPRVRQLAGVDPGAEIGGQRRQDPVEVLVRDDRVAGADVDDRVDLAQEERLDGAGCR